MKERIEITVFSKQDISAAVSMWNHWAETEQMIYAPVTEAQFRDMFLESVHYSEEYMLAAHNEVGELVGFGAGLIKRKYLQGEDFFNTPGYITMIMVSPDWIDLHSKRSKLRFLCCQFRFPGGQLFFVAFDF